MIPHSRPTIDESDAAAIASVLRSGQLSQDGLVARFESRLAASIGKEGGVALSSGTAALHLSLLALNIGPGDEVILPSYVCTALLNAVHYVSATPVIADVNPETFNIDPVDLRKRVTARTRAIILPHLFGLPADLDAILSLGIPVIEDCAMSLGSRYHGRATGGFGTLSVFSFYATKVISTGEGGMVLSDREDLLQTIRDLRDYDEKETYTVRFNYKMTDLQAALGVSQLKRVPSFIARRKEIAGFYNKEIEAAGFSGPRVPADPGGCEHIYYRYVLLTDHLPIFLEEMRVRGIDCRRPVFKPLHRYLGLEGYPATESAWERAVSIPLYPSLGDDDVRFIANTVKAFLS